MLRWQEANLGRRIGERQVGHENETSWAPKVSTSPSSTATATTTTFVRAIALFHVLRDDKANPFTWHLGREGSPPLVLDGLDASCLRTLNEKLGPNFFCLAISIVFEIADLRSNSFITFSRLLD